MKMKKIMEKMIKTRRRKRTRTRKMARKTLPIIIQNIRKDTLKAIQMVLNGHKIIE